MANQSGEMQFNIKFIGQGVKSLEGDVGKMLKSIETTRKAASTIFASGSVESQKFNKALDTLYVGLNSTSKKLQQLAQDTSEESKSLDYLTKTLLTLGGKVGGIINQFGGLKQALNGTTAGISANLKDTINSLEAMGVKSEVVNQLRLRFDKVNEVLKKTGDSTHLLQFNK